MGGQKQIYLLISQNIGKSRKSAGILGNLQESWEICRNPGKSRFPVDFKGFKGSQAGLAGSQKSARKPVLRAKKCWKSRFPRIWRLKAVFRLIWVFFVAGGILKFRPQAWVPRAILGLGATDRVSSKSREKCKIWGGTCSQILYFLQKKVENELCRPARDPLKFFPEGTFKIPALFCIFRFSGSLLTPIF